MNVHTLIAVVLLGLVACGEEPQPEEPQPEEPQPEEPQPEEPPENDVPLLLMEMDSGPFKGPLTVRGTVTLPADTRQGVYTVFEIDQLTSSPIPNMSIWLGPDTTDAKKMRFVITGLADGAYKLRFFVDQNGDNDIDSGDYQGWYGGTVANPVLSFEEATVLRLVGRDHEGVDFGIGRRR